MGTADISGANDDDSTHALPHSQRNDPPTSRANRFPLFPTRLSHPALKAAALIFGLAGALVGVDVLVAETEAGGRAAMTARLTSAALEKADAGTVSEAFAPMARALDAGTWVRITDRDGNALASHGISDAILGGVFADVIASRSIAGPLGTAEAGISQSAVLTPVAWRALGVFALAGLAAFLVGRRLARSDKRQRADALATSLSIISDGAIVWDETHRLAAISGTLRRSTLVPAGLLKRGVSYQHFLDGLRQAGDLNLVSSDKTERHLRLVLPVGETWEMRECLTPDGLLVTRLIDVSDRARLKGEVARLRNRVGEMADEVQTQRVRGDAASRSKTLFLGQLSHSIRTPLNHIIGFADLLRHQSYGKLGDPRYLDYAGNIKQSGEALLDMLANMLELAEFDSGHRVLAKESVRIGELFDWVEGRYAEQARRAGIRLFVERGEERTLTGDQLCLKRLMGNIVDNSLKFTPSGGSITVAAWPTEDGVVLEFTDTGVGIAPDTLTVLNTSFALGNESNGNGLAISRAIAELSGGQLQINSSPGIGTTVAVVLPLKPARTAPTRVRAVA